MKRVLAVSFIGPQKSGKSAAVHALQDIGWHGIDFSTILERRLRDMRGLTPDHVLTRQELAEGAIDLKRRFGAGVLASYACDEIETVAQASSEQVLNVAIAGIRHPGEILEIVKRAERGSNGVVMNPYFVAVIAANSEIDDREIRWWRLYRNHQERGGRLFEPLTQEEFIDRDELEFRHPDPLGTRLQTCFKLISMMNSKDAQHWGSLVNDSATAEEWKKRVQQLGREIMIVEGQLRGEGMRGVEL